MVFMVSAMLMALFVSLIGNAQGETRGSPREKSAPFHRDVLGFGFEG
jgi:hypothetical protein